VNLPFAPQALSLNAEFAEHAEALALLRDLLIFLGVKT